MISKYFHLNIKREFSLIWQHWLKASLHVLLFISALPHSKSHSRHEVVFCFAWSRAHRVYKIPGTFHSRFVYMRVRSWLTERWSWHCSFIWIIYTHYKAFLVRLCFALQVVFRSSFVFSNSKYLRTFFAQTPARQVSWFVKQWEFVCCEDKILQWLILDWFLH